MWTFLAAGAVAFFRMLAFIVGWNCGGTGGAGMNGVMAAFGPIIPDGRGISSGSAVSANFRAPKH